MLVNKVGLRQETYLPEQDRGGLAEVRDFLVAHEGAGSGEVARVLLVGSDPGEQVEIPASIHGLLRQVIEAMSQGLAVTVVPQVQKLTTQQAAELLGVSRPTLIRLLETERIPFERVGAHRRVMLRDALAYREQRRAEQYRVLETTSVDVDAEDDIETVLASLREARRQVARRPRAR